jgi:hypothetical protein
MHKKVNLNLESSHLETVQSNMQLMGKMNRSIAVCFLTFTWLLTVQGQCSSSDVVTLTSDYGTISSGIPYAVSKSCTWLIQPTSLIGSTSGTLTISAAMLELEPGIDVVTIYDGNNTNSAPIAVLNSATSEHTFNFTSTQK